MYAVFLTGELRAGSQKHMDFISFTVLMNFKYIYITPLSIQFSLIYIENKSLYLRELYIASRLQ